ncbi:MAG: efflux RND transporter periplasmic adaptor subunit [Bacteroidetes bacterium HGW-Bacteroidetes-21]|jgi:RND family efflux transporter MFP subunit|nr:MAG: efflux RND transporter periplasmic adaptor subunit [Bacteroidetes bacterium HGW-Bacteroidetes-21]
MKIIFIYFLLFSLFLLGCSQNKSESTDSHGSESPKLKITAYSNEFELFAEADPFVVGDSSNVLSHFSHLPSFKALDSGSVTIRLIIGSSETTETLDKPTRKGIFSFNLRPKTAGTGKIIFDIKTSKGSFQLTADGISVYSDKTTAEEAANKLALSKTNTIVFTKEQSWKINFETALPLYEPFGQVIKTTAQVKSAQGDITVVSAKTDGMILFSGGNILEGINVNAGQTLFTITGSGLADNNSTVRYAEAQNNYNKAKADYDRLKELVVDKIVSEKDLIAAKNEYENAKVAFETFSKNFSISGQSVSCPISGYLKQLYVTNGQFVEAGQPLLSVTTNKTLLLQADVQQKYLSVLGSISSANIRTIYDNKSYTLEELNGKILSYGKSTNDDNYLIPVSLQIDNVGSFLSGGFVELYLKTLSNSKIITVPVTAILEEQGIYSVLVQINPELFEKKEVTIGVTDGIRTEIVSGISKNERIVTNGAIQVKLAQATNALDPHSGHNH